MSVEANEVAPVGAGPHDHRFSSEPRTGFDVHLAVFDGPFDLLLGLIAKHELDITAVSLSTVTDEFIAFIRAMGPVWDLDRASELVIAATLVDLKAARLLPAAEVEDEDDLALLEARDLLFARLLQYRAYKEVSAIFAAMFAAESRRYPRAVGPEPRFAALLPEVLLGLGPQQFAELAGRAMTPRPPAVVSVAHLHSPTVSVREQVAILRDRLRRSGAATFRSLTADCTATVEVVARFLALLDLFRDGCIAFEQVTALGDLLVRWTLQEDADTADEAASSDGETDGEPVTVTLDPDAFDRGRLVSPGAWDQPSETAAGAMTIEFEGEDEGSERGHLAGLQLRGALEAVLLVVDEPADPTVLAQVLGTPEPVIVAMLQALRAEYDEAGRGFELREIAGGWRLYTRAKFAPYVERFVLEGQQARLTQAALETLAVVAYRQPVSRTRVSAVRGVNVDGVIRTLVSRGLVEEAGADHESGAILYRTSPYFLERLGLGDLTELPNLADFLPESTTIDALEDELSSEG